MGLTEFSSQRLIDLEWENEQLKNAIVKHFLGIDLEKRPSNQITICCDEFSSKRRV